MVAGLVMLPHTQAPFTVPAPTGPNTALSTPAKKAAAVALVATAENSTTTPQYSYIEDIGDGRGYTAGIVGFCSGTGDLIMVVERYTKSTPDNALAKYIPALRTVNGTDSHAGLGPAFVADWKAAANDPAFRAAQDAERDRVYFKPAVSRAQADGLAALGQFAYFDAAVVHGEEGLADIRRQAQKHAKTPAQGGNEVAYLRAFFDARIVAMRREAAHRDVSRINDIQIKFLKDGNLYLTGPLDWSVYGEDFSFSKPS